MLDDADPLARVLLSYPPSFRPADAPVPLGNAGGFSGATLWRFEAAGRPMVARAWPIDGPDEAALARIHGWLGALAVLPFVPAPIAARDGRTFRREAGRLWEVTPWMPGATDPAPPPPRLRRAFTAIAEVHRRLEGESQLGPSPGLATRIRLLRELHGGGLDAIAGALDRRGHDPAAPIARDWLAMARRQSRPILAELEGLSGRADRLQPCLRDLRADHVLFVGDDVAGLVDYGAMGIDAPACDLARLLGDWGLAEGPARAEALAAYTAARAFSAEPWALLLALERANAPLIGARWAIRRFVDGHQAEDAGPTIAGLRRSIQGMIRFPGNERRIQQ